MKGLDCQLAVVMSVWGFSDMTQHPRQACSWSKSGLRGELAVALSRRAAT